MSDEPQPSTRAAKPAGPALVPLMMSVVVAVVLAVAGIGGVAYWLAKSGKLGLPTVAAKTEPAEKREPPKFHLVALDPLLVNLADDGGRSYLRIALTLKIEDPPPAKGSKKAAEEPPAKGKPVNEFEAAERDAALGVMGRELGATLLAPEGKEQLKAKLKTALAEHVPEVKVDDVLFTEFLVQK